MEGRLGLRARKLMPLAFILVVAGAFSMAVSPVQAGGSPAVSGHSSPSHSAALNTRCLHPSSGRWLHTHGVWIENDLGCKVRLAGVTWDGMQTTNYVPGGLDYRPYMKILRTIQQLGFNTIRLPLSDQLVRDSSQITISNYVADNPSLMGLHPLQVLDRIVAGAHKLGLMVILDNHFSSARPTSTIPNPTIHPDHNTWTSPGYTERDWIRDWVTLAKRYAKVPTVIGFDLRNEPHTNYGHHPYNLNDYLTRGATWGPYPNAAHPDPRWQPASDWAAAATKAGDAILAVNPHLLMFVEGVQIYPDPTQPRGVEVYTWGGILRGVRVEPIRFRVNHQILRHQLVYSPHEWGPQRDNLMGEFSYKTTYDTMKTLFVENWAFLLHMKKHRLRTPIWLGEFNTCASSVICVSDKRAGSQGQWFQIMLKFLRRNKEVGWSYYPINGTNAIDHPESSGILKKRWKKPRLPATVSLLQSIEKQPG